MVEDGGHKENIEYKTISFNRGDLQRSDYPRSTYDNRSYPNQNRRRYGVQKAENFTYPGVPARGSESDNLVSCVVRNLHYLDQILVKCVLVYDYN